jgi:hypothetical protein
LPVWLAKCEQLPDAPGELSPLCGSQMEVSSCQFAKCEQDNDFGTFRLSLFASGDRFRFGVWNLPSESFCELGSGLEFRDFPSMKNTKKI